MSSETPFVRASVKPTAWPSFPSTMTAIASSWSLLSGAEAAAVGFPSVGAAAVALPSRPAVAVLTGFSDTWGQRTRWLRRRVAEFSIGSPSIPMQGTLPSLPWTWDAWQPTAIGSASTSPTAQEALGWEDRNDRGRRWRWRWWRGYPEAPGRAGEGAGTIVRVAGSAAAGEARLEDAVGQGERVEAARQALVGEATAVVPRAVVGRGRARTQRDDEGREDQREEQWGDPAPHERTLRRSAETW